MNVIIHIHNVRPCCHDDICLCVVRIKLFTVIVDRIKLSENATALAKMLGQFWGHFAYFGTPSDNINVWPPYVNPSPVV